MATKKAKKMDQALVSSKQTYEPKDICKVAKGPDGKKLKVAELKEVMEFIAKKRKNYKPGQLARSRAQIYAELRLRGYTLPERKKKK